MRSTRHQKAVGRARRAAGFSLVELLVGLAVTSLLLLAMVEVFDAGSKVARLETQNSDMQQSLRASHRQITRVVNMAGRGGLPLALPNVPVFQGPALTVRNAAGVGTDNGQLAIGFVNTPMAIPGSDILIARGVFESPVYQVDTLNPADFSLFNAGFPTTDPTEATDGVIVVRDMSLGWPQDLTPLTDAWAANIPEALVLMSPMDERIVAVVELDVANTVVGPNSISLAFKVQGMGHPEYRNLYNSGTGPQPALPVGLNSVAHIGILEEYRFYIRQAPAPLPLPGAERDTPKLSMARMFPGTELPYAGAVANLGIDLADNVLDMQVGLAFDSTEGPAWTDQNGDGTVNEDDLEIYEAPDGEDDDYLFNTKEDDPADAPWNGTAVPMPELYFVRLSLLARTERREPNYQAAEVVGYEDVQALRVLAWNTKAERMFRRRFQQTIIELRNL